MFLEITFMVQLVMAAGEFLGAVLSSLTSQQK
jgi:hypothetical protein